MNEDETIKKWMRRLAFTNILHLPANLIFLAAVYTSPWTGSPDDSMMRFLFYGGIILIIDHTVNIGFFNSLRKNTNRKFKGIVMLWVMISLVLRLMILLLPFDNDRFEYDTLVYLLVLSSVMFGIVMLMLSQTEIAKPVISALEIFGVMNILVVIALGDIWNIKAIRDLGLYAMIAKALLYPIAGSSIFVGWSFRLNIINQETPVQ